MVISMPMVVESQKDSVIATGKHRHVCFNCRSQWDHGEEANRNVAMHTCPKCGLVAIYRETPRGEGIEL